MIRFLIDFWSILEPNLAPRSHPDPQLGAQEGPPGVQLGASWAQMGRTWQLRSRDSKKDQKKTKNRNEPGLGRRQGRTPLSRSLTKISDLDQPVLHTAGRTPGVRRRIYVAFGDNRPRHFAWQQKSTERWTQNEPNSIQKTFKNHSKKSRPIKHIVGKFQPISIRRWTKHEPKINPKSSKNQSKIH